MDMNYKSFWQLEKPPEFGPLQGDLQVDTVVVGAGLCGLLCAYLLYSKGVRDIAVIDAGGVCGGVTSNTTAKITSQHGLIYERLLQGLGEEGAAQYAAANENAVRLYREIIAREKIDCGLAACNAWVYAAKDEDVKKIEEEVRAAQRLGIAARYSADTELPLPVKGAVGFPGQAYFHPLKFAFRICTILAQKGCGIYTDTKATAAEEGVVYTDRGKIRARHIIICSHYPFIDKASLLFARVYQERSYVLALKGVGPIRDMYIDCADGGLSFRPQQDENKEEMLLFGGCGHKTGHENFKLHFDSLAREAGRWYPGGTVAYRWSAQDCMTHDKIPYIGRYHSAGRNIFLATGFSKWGMTGSMAAAELISEQVTKGCAAYEDVFAMDRQDIGLQAKSFVKETADIVGGFLTHLTAADERITAIGNNQGGIVEVDGRRVGVCKDGQGRVFAVKPVCTHMGCAVKWNRDENSWDCACHGSRFDYQGNVIGGPALKPLERLEIEGTQPDFS